VLQALYAHRDRLVTKHELFEIAWPGVVVEENNLQVQISTLRKLLGPYAIATIPGRGYRFTGVSAGTSAPRGDADPRAADDEHGRSPTAPPPFPTNLPRELAPLYGRETESAALRKLLGAHRMVTIAGGPGIGKTVLAQALCHEARGSFDDGVWLVDLAPISDPALVVPTVGRVLTAGADNQATAVSLAERLRASSALLCLDNCEHLLSAVAELAQALLQQAPMMRLLATSQEPLRVAAEQVYRLDALAVPDTNDVEAVREAGAVALFEARAQAAHPRFRLTSDNVDGVIAICRHLDGVALAIELAAARVAALGVDGLRSRLGERFRILTAGHRLALRRHQTLRAALDWSHGLLSPAERAVFRRLGVFVGSFDLDSAQHVVVDEGLDELAALDHLMALVDKSLVMVLEGASPRYRLLETTRSFALEKLHEAGETDSTMDRHLDAMRRRFESAFADRWAVPKQLLHDRYFPDIDNVRAALDWSGREGAGAEPLVALTGACTWLWVGTSRQEGLERSRHALGRIDAGTAERFAARLYLMYALQAHPSATPVEMDAIARGIAQSRAVGDRQGEFRGLAMLVFRLAKLGRFEEAERAAAEAEALYEPGWPPVLLPHMLAFRAHLHALRGRHEQAWADKLRTLQEYERMGDTASARVAQSNLGDLALALGDVDEAVRRGGDAVAALRGDPADLLASGGVALGNLSAALTRAGQLDEAWHVACEAIPLLQRHGSLDLFLDHWALLALRRSRPADAARLIGRSDAQAVRTGDPRGSNEQWAHDATLEELRRSMSHSELDRFLGEGAALTQENAVRIVTAV
jgi:predicted ATPase